MTLRLPTRALAPVIALAVLAGIVATFMVSRTLPSRAESSLAPTPVVKHAKPKPVVRKTKPAVVRKTKAKSATPVSAKAKATPKAVAVRAAPVVPVRKPVEAPKGDPVDVNGVPMVLARVLRQHPVAVVALYERGAAVDELALAEARAGASEVNAGFVAINVRNEPQVRPLTQLLGVLATPSILVYKRPNTLFVRIAGFSDRATVAQAAANAHR